MARVGQKIKLDCTVTGIPTPEVYWTQNGKPFADRDSKVSVSAKTKNIHIIFSVDLITKDEIFRKIGRERVQLQLLACGRRTKSYFIFATSSPLNLDTSGEHERGVMYAHKHMVFICNSRCCRLLVCIRISRLANMSDGIMFTPHIMRTKSVRKFATSTTTHSLSLFFHPRFSFRFSAAVRKRSRNAAHSRSVPQRRRCLCAERSQSGR